MMAMAALQEAAMPFGYQRKLNLIACNKNVNYFGNPSITKIEDIL